MSVSPRAHSAFSLSHAVALLATIFSANGAQGQPGSQPTLEAFVFGKDVSYAEGQIRFERGLAARITAIDRCCQLMPEQREKFNLLGQGDIKRFNDRYLVMSKNVTERRSHLQLWEVEEIAHPFEVIATSSLHHDQSLLGKSPRNILTQNQFSRYHEWMEAECQVRHNEAINEVMKWFDRLGAWPKSQRDKFQILLKTELDSPRNSGRYGSACLILQLGRMDKSKFWNLLPKAQQDMFQMYATTIKPYDAYLRAAGYYPIVEKIPEPKRAAPEGKGR